MGLATSSAAWVLQVPAFAARHRTVTFDNRDVGQSSRPDAPYAIGDMAADVLALADHLDIAEFHLLGVSMGGAIAQQVAVRAPERVRTLTLAVTWAGSGAYGAEKTRLWALEAERFTREEFIDSLMLAQLLRGVLRERRGRGVRAPDAARLPVPPGARRVPPPGRGVGRPRSARGVWTPSPCRST